MSSNRYFIKNYIFDFKNKVFIIRLESIIIMKIAFISTFFPFRGGIAQFNANLFRAFERQYEIKAYTFKRQYPRILFPGKNQYVTESDIVDRIPAYQILDTINPLTYFSSAKMILKDKPDLVLTKFWTPFLAPSLGTVYKKLRKGGVERFAILDNVIPHEKRTGDIKLTKYFLKQNSGFIVMSEKVKNDLLLLRPASKYLQVIHPLYDHFGDVMNREEACSKLGIPLSNKVILFFGFIREYKGLDLLIKAMKLLPEDYTLIVAGESYGDFKRYQNLIDSNTLTSRIRLYIKYIPDKEVPVFFSASDVCVLPYKSATQSGIISISFHFNIPVIATDVGGLKEMVEHGKTGLMVSSLEPKDLSDSIKYYFDRNLKPGFQNNIKEYKKKHSWSALADDIIEFYKTIK